MPTHNRTKEISKLFPDIVPKHRQELKKRAEKETSENKRKEIIERADRTVQQTVRKMFESIAIEVNPGDNGVHIPQGAEQLRAMFDTLSFEPNAGRNDGDDDSGTNEGVASHHIEQVDAELASHDVSLEKSEEHIVRFHYSLCTCAGN